MENIRLPKSSAVMGRNTNCIPQRESKSREFWKKNVREERVVLTDASLDTQPPGSPPRQSKPLECMERGWGSDRLSPQAIAAMSDSQLESHPAVTRLQNLQNQRLEGMERRMDRIRRSAQQEAERRKFAHLFRAKVEDKDHTDRLLREASLALQRLNQEKMMKKSAALVSAAGGDGDSKDLVESLGDSSNFGRKLSLLQQKGKSETDKGEIIPVHVISDQVATAAASVAPVSSNDSAPSEPVPENGSQLMGLLQPIEKFKLDGVVLWLLLPFLLPFLVLIQIIQRFSTQADTHSRKKN